jgi:hypothetical protein
MADSRDEIQEELEQARKARQEAENLRRQAKQDAERLKEDARRARDEARRARDDARRRLDEARSGRREARGSRPGPSGPHGPGFHFGFDDRDEGNAGVRTEQPLALDGITHIQVDQTAGRLTVRPCREGEVPGIVSSGSKATPEVEVQREGSRLTLEVKLSKGWLFRRRQGATTTVRLDGQALEQLKIDNGYGETEVHSIEATDLRVNVGAGSVQCLLTRGNLDVNVGAGKVSVLSHAGLARCDSGTGDVLLDIAEVVPGDYKVDVGLGRAEVRLPAGAQVHIKAASGIGKSRIEYPSAGESATTRLRLNSGIGECVVKTRDTTESADAVKPAGQPRPQRGSGRGVAATARRREGEEMRVLQMLEQGKITPQDAADLIAALQGSSSPHFDEPDDEEPPVFT